VLSVAEIDWGTNAVESSDRALGRAFTRLACDELRNGLIPRELPWRLRELGFERIRIIPEVQVAQDLDAFHHWSVVPSLSHFVRIGGFAAAAAAAFLDDLQNRARQGHYFSSRIYYPVRDTPSPAAVSVRLRLVSDDAAATTPASPACLWPPDLCSSALNRTAHAYAM